jgi:hypothetical protein
MRVEEALAIARKWHGEQRDKVGEDYVTGHLLRVAMAVDGSGSKPDLVVAAALHDSLEDTACTADDLRRAGVTEETIRIISVVTHQEHEAYTDFITRVIEGGQSPIQLKLADIGDNLNPDRLSLLEPHTAERLKRKYVPARTRLLNALA